MFLTTNQYKEYMVPNQFPQAKKTKGLFIMIIQLSDGRRTVF